MTFLELEPGKPKLLSPTNSFALVQNKLSLGVDKLLVSTTNDNKANWIEVLPGSAIKFDEPLYFKQTTRHKVKFPVIEGS